MKLDAFFANQPLFTSAEFSRFLNAHGTPNPFTQRSLLAYHRQQGRILLLRRGLYAVVPPGVSREEAPVDPYLLASRLAPEAVLAYHTALEVHGRNYSVFHTLYYLAHRSLTPFVFRNDRFQAVRFPVALARAGKSLFGVIQTDRQGLRLRVTSLERTLVDALDRPDLAGGGEEVFRSLESVEYFDLDTVLRYVKLLGNATTAAKVGFFLEQHRETLMVKDSHLNALQKLRPKEAHYFERPRPHARRREARLVARWNLVVPDALLHRTVTEVL
jgi:predicted transcriptional regulator of viral defense system